MSEREKARARAQGALENFLESMGERMMQEGRSFTYIEEFWEALESAMFHSLSK